MIVELKRVPESRKRILFRLMQLYLYDFSGIEGIDIGPNGLFSYSHLGSYWKDPTRIAYLVYADGCVAGFVLVNSYTCVLKMGEGKSIGEFFVLRKYRRKGVGREAAYQVFDKFPGKWEVRQIAANRGGQEFWRNVISAYTGGSFREVRLDNAMWKGPAQTFDNSKDNIKIRP